MKSAVKQKSQVKSLIVIDSSDEDEDVLSDESESADSFEGKTFFALCHVCFKTVYVFRLALFPDTQRPFFVTSTFPMLMFQIKTLLISLIRILFPLLSDKKGEKGKKERINVRVIVNSNKNCVSS